MPPKMSRKAKLAAKKLKIAEQKRQLRRDHLNRELKYTDMNWKVIRGRFRDLMLKVKLPWIRQDMETMWHRFDFTVDLKNYVISCILDELDEDELQTEYNMAGHVEAFDELIKLMEHRWKELYDKYHADLQDLLGTNTELINNIKNKQSQDELHMNTMLFAMEKTSQEQSVFSEGDSASKVEEENDRAKDQIRLMCGLRERILEDMWTLFKNTMTTYENDTAEKRKAYDVLRKRDIRSANTIEQQLLNTQKLYELIKSLREKLNAINPKHVLRHLTEERQYFAETFFELRHRLTKNRIHDNEQLIKLTVESNASIKKLQLFVEKGNRILQLASICRKYETQNEKVMPFPRTLEKKDEEGPSQDNSTELIEEKEDEETADNPLLQVYHDYRDMEPFWRRVGQSQLRRGELLAYNEQLRSENDYLRDIMCRYMMGVSDDNEVPKEIPIKKNNERIHVIEASYIYQNFLPQHF